MVALLLIAFAAARSAGNDVTPPFESPAADPEALLRRQKSLLVIAWTATLLPLAAFGYLTWQSLELNKRVQTAQQTLDASAAKAAELDAKRKALAAEIEQLSEKLDAQRAATKHYRDLAGIRIQFYRAEDRAVVEKALVKLGFRLETNLGVSRLIDLKPNTIAYGSLVSDKDLRDIAVALVEAGFPLKRIAPAIKQPDPQLVQIYASAQSDRECGSLTVVEIRDGRTCGEPRK